MKKNARINVLVGHDTNITSILSNLEVKPYHLPGQFQKTPIGGKVVFERWKDKQGASWFKMECIYQSAEQIRNVVPLNHQQPAQHFTLELNGCPVDNNGFCSFDTFIKFLEKKIAN